jgi:hypothetical protein
MNYSLIIKFEVFDNCISYIFSHDIIKLSEPWPNNHIELVKVKIENHNLVLMQKLFILFIDYAHHNYCILIMQLILDIRSNPFEIVIHNL